VVELRVRFHEVNNSEFVWFASSGIFNTEVEPLSVPFGEEIWPENQIVFIVVNLNRSS
jgi:hypothetical protein